MAGLAASSGPIDANAATKWSPPGAEEAKDKDKNKDNPAQYVAVTRQGLLQGFRKDNVTQFLGIPYAAPPVGQLRWRPPVPHAPWAGIRQATSFGPNCAQKTLLGVYAGPATPNENCLFLNVYSGAKSRDDKLPVIVYFHGGGEQGEGSDFDGSKLAARDTVVVTLNFRLSALGVMAHPALDNEGHLFGNYAILDQQQALRWVQENIAAFGGNPNNVTISGQSYGAKATTYQVLSPLAKGLFHRAIMQSALVYLGSTPLGLARERGVAFAVAAGCGSGTGPDVAACLRALPASKVWALMGNGVPDPYDPSADTGKAGYVVSGAISDGQILPVSELQAYNSGNFNKVPMMTGDTLDEGGFLIVGAAYYKSPRVPLTEDEFLASVNATYAGNAGPGGSPPAYPAGTAQRVLDKYPLSNYPTPQQQWMAMSSDRFACNMYHMVQILHTKVPLWTYEFRDRTAPVYFPPLPGYVFGAYHTGDSQYIFPLYHGGPRGITHPLNAEQQRLSDGIVVAWTNFAATGNPNRSGDAPWPRYKGPNGGTWLVQDVQSRGGISLLQNARFVADHKCDFWETVLVFP